jgi:hypothetical protein
VICMIRAATALFSSTLVKAEKTVATAAVPTNTMLEILMEAILQS